MRGRECVVSSAVLGLALSFASTLSAQKCPCGPMPSVQDALHGASAVFEGYVQDLTFLDSQPPVARAQLRVVRAWKGMPHEQVTVLSPPRGLAHDVHEACTSVFEPGDSYLIYALARREDGQLELSGCGRTRPISAADEDLARLGMGSAPVSAKDAEPPPAANDPKPNEPPARGGCASCSALGASANTNAALPALLVLSLAAWRMRRRLSP